MEARLARALRTTSSAALRRGAGDPSFRREADGTLWRAVITPEGPVTIRIRARPADAEIELEAWGSGADWMLDNAPAMLGAEDDVNDFDPRDERVRAAWTTNPHWRVTKTRLVLEALVASCLEQKVTGQEAWTGWRTLLYRFGDDAPGPGAELGMKMMPSAEALTRIPSWEWLRCHIDGARSRPIVELLGSLTRCNAPSISRRPRSRRRSDRCPASVSGPQPRSGSGLTATPTRSASATITSPPMSVGR